MPNATVSEELWDTIRYLFSKVRRTLLDNPGYLAALVPLTRQDGVAFDYVPYVSTDFSESDPEFQSFTSFIRRHFPQYDVSPQSKWCWPDKHIPRTDEMLEIHGRLAAALVSPQSDSNVSRLRFVIIVIILHYLGHAVVNRFQGYTDPLPVEIDQFPYHKCTYLRHNRDVPEPGFFVEEALFGGIIGIVFREDAPREYPPRFLHSDLTRISYLFLHCRDGSTYRLGTSDIDTKVSKWRFTPFDTQQLERIDLPRRVRQRTCAFYNGDHIVMTFPGEGGDIPRRPRSRSLSSSRDGSGSESTERSQARARPRSRSASRTSDGSHELPSQSTMSSVSQSERRDDVHDPDVREEGDAASVSSPH